MDDGNLEKKIKEKVTHCWEASWKKCVSGAGLASLLGTEIPKHGSEIGCAAGLLPPALAFFAELQCFQCLTQQS